MPMKILHLERDAYFIKLIKKIVTEKGFSYTCVNSYPQVYEALKQNNFDLVIADQNLRLTENSFMLKKICLHEFIHPPTIIISQEKNIALKEWCYIVGITAYLRKKSFDIKRFNQHLQTIYARKDNIAFLKKISIAVIDDSKISLQIIKNFFSFYDVENVNYFSDPSEFLNSDFNYDLLIVDLFMPKYDGEDLIIKIREKNDVAIIILITAYNNGNVISRCLTLGANEFILKPLNLNLFMAVLDSCITQYKLKNQAIINTQKLFELATRDGLTGIYNRTFFINSFKEKAAETLRTKLPFSFILLDIDHFKSINDEFGHLKGDYVLKELASILKHNLRETDVLCRWGGEEFIILLSNTSLDNAIKLAEKLRITLETHRFSGLRKITASFGVTQWYNDDGDESAFKRLDNSLYLAKLTGRNKVVADEEIQLIPNGPPMVIECGPFFRSGNLQVDEDHSRLISMANEIIFKCFKSKVPPNSLTNLFTDLSNEIVEHFKREEEVLTKFNYNKYEEHKEIHDTLINKTIQIRDRFETGEETVINIMNFIIQEVVIGHIIKSDFDFFHIFKVNKLL